jgi:hypothetical protein
MRIPFGTLLAVALTLSCSAPAFAVTPDKFNPADYTTPICLAPLYVLVAADQTCAPVPEAINKLGQADCEKNEGFVFTPAVAGKPASGAEPEVKKVDQSCKAGTAKAPAPVCKLLPTYDSAIKDKQCVYTKAAATSITGNYVGDCIRIDGVPDGMDVNTGDHFVVTAQREIGDKSDKMLTVLRADKRELLWLTGMTFTCKSRGGKPQELSAEALLDKGARRYGWAFGALALPYKYFRKESAFVTGIPVGLYTGYRWGAIGSGFTFAMGATVGSVKADTVERDASGTITKTTGSADVAAIGTTVGLIMDVAKARDTRPFKLGLFYGSDRVSKDQTTVNYKYNKRPWFAFQIGYDFTDN